MDDFDRAWIDYDDNFVEDRYYDDQEPLNVEDDTLEIEE